MSLKRNKPKRHWAWDSARATPSKADSQPKRKKKKRKKQKKQSAVVPAGIQPGAGFTFSRVVIDDDDVEALRRRVANLEVAAIRVLERWYRDVETGEEDPVEMAYAIGRLEEIIGARR